MQKVEGSSPFIRSSKTRWKWRVFSLAARAPGPGSRRCQSASSQPWGIGCLPSINEFGSDEHESPRAGDDACLLRERGADVGVDQATRASLLERAATSRREPQDPGAPPFFAAATRSLPPHRRIAAVTPTALCHGRRSDEPVSSNPAKRSGECASERRPDLAGLCLRTCCSTTL